MLPRRFCLIGAFANNRMQFEAVRNEEGLNHFFMTTQIGPKNGIPLLAKREQGDNDCYDAKAGRTSDNG